MHSSCQFTDQLLTAKLNLCRKPTRTLQINVGKFCNQACLHCHVEAGPKRTEKMNKTTCDRILELLSTSRTIDTVDITGGAPELHEVFRPLVSACKARGLHVMDRCNLTVLFVKGQEDTADFLAQHEVEITASLPCYTDANVEKQRGKGVFAQSIRGLKKLNALGYGKQESPLKLNLVYNPVGAYLPGNQAELEQDYKKELANKYGIEFNRLFTITNMPIKRFLHDLQRDGQLETYMQLLIDNFNPIAAEGVMCRDLISIGWDGQIYDCDFNQMLELPIAGEKQTVFSISSLEELEGKEILFDDHCFGCTAGAGSSCSGSTVS